MRCKGYGVLEQAEKGYSMESMRLFHCVGKVWSVSICVSTHCGFPSAIQVKSRLSPSLVKPSGYVTTIFTSGLSDKKKKKSCSYNDPPSYVMTIVFFSLSHLQPKPVKWSLGFDVKHWEKQTFKWKQKWLWVKHGEGWNDYPVAQ